MATDPMPHRFSLLSIVALLLCAVLLAQADTPAFSLLDDTHNEEPHLERARRMMFALATEWVSLRIRVRHALPRIADGAGTDTGTAVFDANACSAEGDTVSVGNVSTATACNPLRTFDCVYTCRATDLMTTARKAALDAALSAAEARLTAALRVQASSPFLTFTGVPCGPMNITGVFSATLVVAVSTRIEADRTALASISREACERHPDSGRPTMFHINVDPTLLDEPAAAATTVLRLYLHSMAFSTALVSHWRHPSQPSQTYFEFDNLTYATGPVIGDLISRVNSTVKFPTSPVPGVRVKLITANAIVAAREYFGCASVPTVELEDTGYGTGMLFLEKRLFREELMTVEPVTANVPRYISPITRAVLIDSGWYEVDAALVDTAMKWGKGVGCAWTSLPCGGGGWPTPKYRCTDFDAKPACGYDSTFTGRCNLQILKQPLPAPYQVLSNSLLFGGDDFAADACPYIVPDQDAADLGRCSVTPTDFNPSSRGSTRSTSAQCFMSSTRGVAASHGADAIAACFDTACVATTLHVRIGQHYVPCTPNRTFEMRPPRTPFAGGDTIAYNNISANVATLEFRGKITCPDAAVHADMCAAGSPAKKPNFWPTMTHITPSTGSANGGMTITVHGKNLVNCKSVRIGGVVVAALYHFPTATLQGRTRHVAEQYGSFASDGLGPTDVELWCEVADVCPEGCGVDRLARAFNLTDWVPCNMTDDVVTCRDQPTCEWINNECRDRQTAPPPTPQPTPAPPPSTVDKGCFSAAPKFCSATGKCAAAHDLCMTCSGPLEFQCWNSACVHSVVNCPCRPDFPHRCPDGTCAALFENCAQTCASPNTLCWNHECVSDPLDCPCPPAEPLRCNQTGRCVSVESQCSTDRCPNTAPFRCWDDRCAFDARSCRCEFEKPTRCAGGSCVDPRTSPCPCPTGYTKDCGKPAGCLPQSLTCPSNVSAAKPCGVTQYRCPDDRCVADMFSCVCSETEIARPIVQIVSPFATTVIVSETHFFVADVDFAPCGIDRSWQVTHLWKLVRHNSDAPPSIDPQLLTAAVLRIPALALLPNATYTLSVTVTAPNKIFTTASITVTGTDRKPTMALAGAYRDVPSTGAVYVTALVADDDNPLPEQFSWECCKVHPFDTTACSPPATDPCPPLLASISTVTTPSVRIEAVDGIPLGAYFFAARYKSAAVTHARVDVTRGRHRCFVYPLAPVYRSNEDVTLRVVLETIDITDPSAFYALKWLMNGSTVAGQTALQLQIDGGVLPPDAPTTLTATITTESQTPTRCSYVIVPRRPVGTGVCQVINTGFTDPDAGANMGTALTSRVTVNAFGWDVPRRLGGTSRVLYRFGYVDLTQQAVILSPDFTPSPQLTVRPPVLAGNPSLVQIRFFVQAIDEADAVAMHGTIAARHAANATCAFNVKAVPDRAASSILVSLRKQLSLAESNVYEVLASCSRVAAFISDDDLSEFERLSAASEVLVRLDGTLMSTQSPHSFTPTTRSMIIGILTRLSALLTTGRTVSNAGTRVVVRGATQPPELSTTHVAMAMKLFRAVVPPMLSDAMRVGTGEVLGAAAAPSDAIRTKASVFQLLDVVELGDELLRLHNWLGDADEELAADILDAIASALPLRRTTRLMDTPETTTAGSGAAHFLQRSLLRDRVPILAATSEGGLASVSVHAPTTVVRTVSGSTAAVRITGSVYNIDRPPVNTTDGLAVLTTIGNVTTLSRPVIMSPMLRYRLLVEHDANPVTLSQDSPIEVTFTFAIVSSTLATANITCAEITHASGSWNVYGEPTVSGRAYTCPSWCVTAGCYVALVVRDPQEVVVTDAQTEQQLFASLASIAGTLSIGAWFAIGLSIFVFLAAVVAGICYIRSKRASKVKEAETEGNAEQVHLSELLREDPELRTALEVARVRQLYLADL